MAKQSVPAGNTPDRGRPATMIGQAGHDAVNAAGRTDPKLIRTLTCRTVARGRLQQLNYIRDLPPQAVMQGGSEGLASGTDAPDASEALLAALGSCLAAGIQANALARNIPLQSLELQLFGDIAASAAWGSGDPAPKPIGFETIRVSVNIVADAPRDILETLVRHTTLWSPVANTLHNPVHLDVSVEPDAAAAV